MNQKIYEAIDTKECRRMFKVVLELLVIFIFFWGLFVALPEYNQRDLGNKAKVEVISRNGDEYKVGISYGIVYSEEWRVGDEKIGNTWTELQGDTYEKPTSWKRTVWVVSVVELAMYVTLLGILGNMKHKYYVENIR